MTNLVCVCCGTAITAPQFFKGLAYGWTCIKKVSSQKRNKSKLGYIPCEIIPTESKRDITLSINGVLFELDFPRYIIESPVQFEGIEGSPDRTTKANIVDGLQGIIDLDIIKALYVPTYFERLISRMRDAENKG